MSRFHLVWCVSSKYKNFEGLWNIHHFWGCFWAFFGSLKFPIWTHSLTDWCATSGDVFCFQIFKDWIRGVSCRGRTWICIVLFRLTNMIYSHYTRLLSGRMAKSTFTVCMYIYYMTYDFTHNSLKIKQKLWRLKRWKCANSWPHYSVWILPNLTCEKETPKHSLLWRSEAVKKLSITFVVTWCDAITLDSGQLENSEGWVEVPQLHVTETFFQRGIQDSHGKSSQIDSTFSAW